MLQGLLQKPNCLRVLPCGTQRDSIIRLMEMMSGRIVLLRQVALKTDLFPRAGHTHTVGIMTVAARNSLSEHFALQK